MHEHDYDVHDEDQYDVEWGENGDVVAYIDCVEPIITASHVDPQRDEVYEESRTCLSTLTRYWTVKDVLWTDGDEQRVVSDSETTEDVLEQIDLQDSAMSFVEFGNLLEVGDETSLVFDHDDIEFEVVFELAEVTQYD